MIQPPLASRLLLGALAGGAATAAMTAAMTRLHSHLPVDERYPLPPREIVEQLLQNHGPTLSDGAIRDLSAAAHFGYGGLSGALMGAVMPGSGVRGGAIAGLVVWLVSYFGIWPAGAKLTPPTRHPARRNGLMIGAHLVWGAVTMLAFRELLRSRATIFAAGPIKDVARR